MICIVINPRRKSGIASWEAFSASTLVWLVSSWESKVPLVFLNKALLGPYFLGGGGFGGVTLGSHDIMKKYGKMVMILLMAEILMTKLQRKTRKEQT